MPNSCLVSFVLMTYNQANYVLDALKSALAQDYRPLELIVSDDCSSDETYSIIKKELSAYSGTIDVKVFRNSKNLGLIEHVNKVFERAGGELIVVAAGDDVSLPERTSVLVDHYLAQDKPLLIHSKAYEIDASGIRSGIEAPPRSLRRALTPKKSCVSRSIYLGASAAWSRDLYEKYGPIQYEHAYEDLVLGFRAIVENRIFFVDKALLNYRVTSGISPCFGCTLRVVDVLEVHLKIAKVMIDTLRQRKDDLSSRTLGKSDVLHKRINRHLWLYQRRLELYNCDTKIRCFFLTNFLQMPELLARELIFWGSWYLKWFLNQLAGRN